MLHRRAPAKLNLYLRVLGRRPDGYHELETIFERIDLADELTFEPAASTLQLTCSDPTLSCGEENLILKAARLLQQTTGSTAGARLHLTKRIPIAAGLGGGSSDAAATLLGLNELWALGLPRPQLVQLAARLGSDVPFFFCASPFAIGRGRGEVCEPIPEAPRLTQVLACPPARLSTKEIYAGSEFDLTAVKPSITMVTHALRNGPAMAGLATGLWNDLEPEAIRRCPVISFIQLQLRDLGCLGTRVSGSGPSVFGLCQDVQHGQAVAEHLRRHAPSLGVQGEARRWRIELIQTDHSSLTVIPSIA